MSLNTINVVPVAYTKQITSIQFYLQYVFNQTQCDIVVYFLDSTGSMVKTEVLRVAGEAYENWTDDASFVEYILSRLNLTAA